MEGRKDGKCVAYVGNEKCIQNFGRWTWREGIFWET